MVLLKKIEIPHCGISIFLSISYKYILKKYTKKWQKRKRRKNHKNKEQTC
jgi:hypothetical protein